MIEHHARADADGSLLQIEVGDLAVPKLFGLTFTTTGDVLRVCTLIWRRGAGIGARFVSASELRKDAAAAKP